MTPEDKQAAYREYRRQWAIAVGNPYPQDGGDTRVGDAKPRTANKKKGTNF